MTGEHLSEDLILRHNDGELTASEVLAVATHAATCDQCREHIRQLIRFSEELEAAVSGIPISSSNSERDVLVEALAKQQAEGRNTGAQSVVRRWAWTIGLAASLAIAMLFSLRHLETKRPAGTRAVSSTFEVGGESFIPLPYSNPDLPISSSHIVQMQVPVSSLADAGIVFEPISSQAVATDRSVLADVLLGVDGQPVAVHVLEAE